MKKNLRKINMLALLMMLLPFAGIGQVKNVISTHRVFPKVDKVLEFEKALAVHAQKYHTGDAHWRVFEIQSGPDLGGYHITEGPKSWESEDERGTLGEEHTIDWNKNVAIYLTDRQSGGYSVYVDSLSTIAVGDFSDKIQITHVYPKIGWTSKIVSMIKKLKAAWTAEGSTIAVYAVNGSGPAQYAIVNRYKQGLKEKASGFRKPFRQTYDAVHGAGAYDEYVEDLRLYVNESWSELLFMRKDLSSK
ncbi:MAG TPA: hypothetical protein PLY34_00535 [Ferruginibacter sp.]|nr:hypothetical protein [Ferruginibacter sp.]HPH92744.1 hypothetical protein [Ferruginibacter sp.]